MSAFSKNLFDLLGDGDNEAPAAPVPAAKAAPQPAAKEQVARPKSEKSKRGGKSEGRLKFSNFISIHHLHSTRMDRLSTNQFHHFTVLLIRNLHAS
jgi:hypothetical protein